MSRRGIRSLAISIVFALFMGVGLQAFGQSMTRELLVTRDAKIGDKQLAKGKYSISFDDSKDGELSVMKGSQEIARVNYKLVDLGKGASSSVVVFSAADDGSFQVRRIEMKGAKFALQIE